MPFALISGLGLALMIILVIFAAVLISEWVSAKVRGAII